MSGDISWVLELEITEGRERDFQALMQEMVRATQANEPGTLVYEWSTTPDGRTCHISERYADSASIMAHLTAFGQKFAGRFLDILKPVRFVIYGSPSAEVRQGLSGFNPVYMQPVGGFNRSVPT